MNEETAQLSNKERTFLSTILLFIAVLIGFDILSDAKEGARFGHIAIEFFVGLAALGGYGVLLGLSMRTKTYLRRTKESLIKSQQEAVYWRSNAQAFIAGLSQAIDQQFKQWNFSPAEKEVALLFLKGLSSKEIAEIRGVAEKTVRAQATTIYEKSGLTGRAELSAFFLEDLLAPQVTVPFSGDIVAEKGTVTY